MANENEKTAAVIRGSLGKELYLKLGFKLVGDIHIQLDGEENKMNLSVLAYGPEGEPKRKDK